MLNRMDDSARQLEQKSLNISTKKAIMYLLCVPVTILFITLPTKNYLGGILHLLFLISYGLTLGFKDIKGYIRKINSWKDTFYIGTKLLIISIVIIGIFLIGDNDPQGISKLEYSGEATMLLLSKLPLIAVGEEFFKFFVFMGLLSLIRIPIRHRLVIVTMLSSFIFGYMHVINYKITAGLILSLCDIPYCIFFIYYQSILPLIIAHFIQDGLNFISHYKTYGNYLAQLIGFIIFFIPLILVPMLYEITKSLQSIIVKLKSFI